MKAEIIIPEEMIAAEYPLGLYFSGKASSKIYLNGAPLGANGVPGDDKTSETPGMMDSVLYVPRNRLRLGENSVVILMSGHHSRINLSHPLHGLLIGKYVNPSLMIMQGYWPSLITFGAFVLGVLYFGVSSIRSRQNDRPVILFLISLFAACQLLAEVARGVFPYAYPVHDIRLMLILIFSMGFGLCLAGHVIAKFATRFQILLFLGAAIITIASTFLTGGFDGKSLLAVLTPTVLSASAAIFWAYQKKPRAWWYAGALSTFAAFIALFPYSFLDTGFFYAVVGLLSFLFVQQAMKLAEERNLRQSEQERAGRLELALEQARQKEEVGRIKIKSAGKIEVVQTNQIAHCKGAGDYVEISLVDGAQLLHSASLNELETNLPPTFIRVHRSYLVNTSLVQSLEREASGVGSLILSNGDEIPVSRRIMPKVRSALYQ